MAKRLLSKISVFLLTLAIVFAASGFLVPQMVRAQAEDPGVPCMINGVRYQMPTAQDCIDAGGTTPPVATAGSSWWSMLNPLEWPRLALTAVVHVILNIVALITGLAGVILNGVIYHTVVNMSQSYNNPAGLGAGIGTAWRTVRDVANMGFIFVLLYAAIQTILGIGSDTRKLIVRVIIIAILINFSMFFTRLVIDVANVLALFFYDAIAPGAASAGFSVTQTGLSNAFMRHLHLTSLYNVQSVDLLSIGAIGVMGSIMLLVAAFVFFAAAIMFVIRYVVLIFTLILSPLAFMGWVIPGLKSKVWDKWWDALSGQAFFAPVYFLLIWVTLRVLSGVMSSFGVNPGNAQAALGALTNPENISTDVFATIINFIVVIVFLIAALIIAKDWANKAGSGVTNATKWMMGAAGTATLGTAGWAGRQTFGRASQAVAESEALKKARTWSNQRGGILGTTTGALVRGTQAVAKKGGASTFDVRGSRGYESISGTTGVSFGKADGKGGYEAWRKEAVKREEEYAKSLAPSEKAIGRAQRVVDRAETDEERREAQAKLNQLKGVKDTKIIAEIEADEIKNDPVIKELEKVEKEYKDKEKDIAETIIPELKKQKEEELKAMEEGLKAARDRAEQRTKEIKGQYRDNSGNIQPIKSAGEVRKEAEAKSVENSYWARGRGYNFEAAAKIRKGKSTKEEAAELVKKMNKEDGGDEEEPKAPETPTTPPSIPPAEDSKAA